MGQAWTHSPQPTQVLAPMGRSRSNTTLVPAPRKARPMTSLCWTSRQARRHSPHWMQAVWSSTMAAWLASVAGLAWDSAGKRLAPSPARPTHSASRPCGACSAVSSSSTMRRAFSARAEAVRTTMPAVGLRTQAAVRVRSPSTSTTQARQLPSGR